MTGSAAGDGETVAVGPVRIPDYLDRPQIVTSSGDNEIRLAEFDRWAGSLDEDVVRVLVSNISALLPADRFFVTRWISVPQSVSAATYRVEVDITRLEGTPGKSVFLEAQWSLFHKEKGILLKRKSSISREVNGAGYEAFVAALSNTLEGLSREIAEAIRSLQKT